MFDDLEDEPAEVEEPEYSLRRGELPLLERFNIPEQEIDWVEEREGKLLGYEIKMSSKKVKAPGGWLSAYQEASFEVINSDNYLKFIS